MNRKQFIESLMELVKTESQERRLELQGQLHHYISTVKVTLSTSSELTAKNHIIHEIQNYVQYPNDTNRGLVLTQLELFPAIIDE